MVYALSFVFFTTIFAILLTIISKRRNHLKGRLEKFLPQDIVDTTNKKTNESKTENVKIKVTPNSGKQQFIEGYVVARWDKRLERAGINTNPQQFFYIRILTILALFLGFLLLDFEGVLLYLSIPIGFYIPIYYVKKRTTKRLNQFSEQLAEALGIIANGMRSGFSFMQALKMVGSEMPEPLGPEFSRTLRDINHGLSIEEGFHYLLERIPSRELELVVNALLVQRSTGGNLGDLLETMQETIRGRVKIKEELKTLTAQVKMSSWIVTLLPPALALYLNFMNPDYFSPMLEHILGKIMIGFSITFIIFGWLLIRKIARIEV